VLANNGEAKPTRNNDKTIESLFFMFFSSQNKDVRIHLMKDFFNQSSIKKSFVL